MDKHTQVLLSNLPKWLQENMRVVAARGSRGISVTWTETDTAGDEYTLETYIRDYPRNEAWRALKQYMTEVRWRVFHAIPFLIRAVVFGNVVDFDFWSGSAVDVEDVCAAKNPCIQFHQPYAEDVCAAKNLSAPSAQPVNDNEIPF